MADTPRIIALAGSTREGSFNRKLVRVAAEGAKNAGAEVTTVDLREYPLPFYDGDLEAAQGWPENAKKLRELFLKHDGFLIASPEYNYSISGVLKNTIDWLSRPIPGGVRYDSFTDKPIVIMSTSPGPYGGARGLPTLRILLVPLGAIVLPNQIAVTFAEKSFDKNGQLHDAKLRDSVRKLGSTLTEFIKRHKQS